MGLRNRMRASIEKRVPPARLAHLAFDRGNWPLAIHYGHEAIEPLERQARDGASEMERIGVAPELAEMRLLVGMAHKKTDDAGQACSLLRQVYDDGLIDATAFSGEMARTILALAEMQIGSYAKLPALLADLKRSGSASKQAFAFRIDATITWRLTGDLGAASALLEQSVLADPPDRGPNGVWWHDAIYRAGFLADAGRYEQARQFAEPAIEQQRRLVDPANPGTRTDLGVTCGQYGRILAHLDELDEAERFITEGSGLLTPDTRYAWTYALYAQAVWHTKCGNLDQAEATLADAWALASKIGLMPTCIELLVGRMDVDLARGDRDAFDRHRSQALDLCRMLGHVAEQRHIEALGR